MAIGSSETIKQELPKFILQALEEGLKAEYDEAAKRAVEAFEKEIERKRTAVIATVMLNVSNFMSISDMRDRIVLEIRKEDPKPV